MQGNEAAGTNKNIKAVNPVSKCFFSSINGSSQIHEFFRKNFFTSKPSKIKREVRTNTILIRTT